MAKKITEEVYWDKARNGSRVLFNVNDYRLLDGTKDEDESYFLIDFEKDTYYELSLKEAYNLLALYSCDDVPEYILIEQIKELIHIV